MAEVEEYTAEQVAVAARELQQAAGTEATPQQTANTASGQLTKKQVVSMLSDEIRMLRERGFSDDRIAGLISGFEIPLTGDELTRLDKDDPRWDVEES